MKVSTFFDRQIKPMISSYLAKANESVEIAVTWFTDKELYNTLCNVARRGVRVELILANHHINHESSIRYEDLTDVGGQVFFMGESEKDYSLMHLKFCIIDTKILITGSYNYTYKAQINHENVLVSEEDYKNILSFHKKFIDLKRELSNITEGELINPNKNLIPFVQYQHDSTVVKWGFCDENKNITIPLIYEDVGPFFDGFAAVKKNNLWGFVNQYGNEVIKCQYSSVDFKQGIVLGYIDKMWKKGLPFGDGVNDFTNYCFFHIKYSLLIVYDFVNNSVIIFNKIGKKIIEIEGKLSIINYRDRILEFQKSEYIVIHQEHLSGYGENTFDEYSIFDLCELKIIFNKVDNPDDFYCNYIGENIFSLKETEYLVDNKNIAWRDFFGDEVDRVVGYFYWNIKTNIKFKIKRFDQNLDRQIIFDGGFGAHLEYSTLTILDSNLNIITQIDNVATVSSFSEGACGFKIGEFWGYFDKKGKIFIKPQYQNVGSFKEGLAWVTKKYSGIGYVNKLGIEVIPMKYSSNNYKRLFDYQLNVSCEIWGGANFENGLVKVSEDKKYFYINKKGVEFYEEIESPAIKNISSEIITIELIKAIEAGWELKTTEDDILFLENDNEQYIILDFTLKEVKQNPTIEVIATDEENVYRARIAN